MDEQGFAHYQKKAGKSERTIRGSLACLRRFEAFLSRQGKLLDQAEPRDLRAFVDESTVNGEGVAFLAISDFYEWAGKCEEVRWTAHEMFAWNNFQAYKLSEMLGVDAKHIRELKARGIVTAKDLLKAGKTPLDRASLAQETGIPTQSLLEMVRLADLARVGGLKTIRGRLYYDAGFVTLDNIAAATAEEVREKLAGYIRLSGFKGIPPTLKEAGNAVALAKRLPRLVEEIGK